MVLKQMGSLAENPLPLTRVDLPEPVPDAGEVLIQVFACGVCHTELDEIEGRTPPPKLPIVLGHQIVGSVIQNGKNASHFKIGERVGVGWIHSACGHCALCRQGYENLCDQFKATGRDAHGGYAEYTAVGEDFAYHIPARFSDSQAAPLLCAGAIGYRSLRLSNLQDGALLGLTGFGASAHLVLKMAGHLFPNTPVFVFARSAKERDFARQLGAFWTGDTESRSPEKLDGIIDTTPAWTPIIAALRNLTNGGRLVINAIRKETADKQKLLDMDYSTHLWMEKEIKTVANVTRNDIREFLQLAAEIPITPEVEEFALEDANQALMELKERKIRGAKVLKIA